MGITRTVLVASATGPIGRLLVARGHRVAGTTQRADRARALVQTGAIRVLVGMTLVQVFFHRFAQPLDASKAPPSPVSPIKTLSYAIQAQPALGWFELAVIGALLFISPWVGAYAGNAGPAWTSWICGAVGVIAGLWGLAPAEKMHHAHA